MIHYLCYLKISSVWPVMLRAAAVNNVLLTERWLVVFLLIHRWCEHGECCSVGENWWTGLFLSVTVLQVVGLIKVCFVFCVSSAGNICVECFVGAAERRSHRLQLLWKLMTVRNKHHVRNHLHEVGRPTADGSTRRRQRAGGVQLTERQTERIRKFGGSMWTFPSSCVPTARRRSANSCCCSPHSYSRCFILQSVFVTSEVNQESIYHAVDRNIH